MTAYRRIVLTAGAATLASCASLGPRPAGDGFARVNPASVAAAPAQYDGKPVEMVGLLVWEFENFGLYQSYGAYCRRGDQAAIHVEWGSWPGVTRADNRRLVEVRGVFRNRVGVTQPDGSILIGTGAAGPGPLEPGQVVRWLSPPQKPCPAVRP